MPSQGKRDWHGDWKWHIFGLKGCLESCEDGKTGEGGRVAAGWYQKVRGSNETT